ncbi:hypothetical protein EAF00_003692 [Botryotinia globosa]|nr:hypothetical protein EAF00_003692 [Botryotinia globosa]
MALKTPWPICTTYQAIPYTLFQNVTINDPHPFWPSFSEFASSASRGCHTCTLLYEAIREPFKHRLEWQPIFLERGTIDIGGTEAVALTVDLASLTDHSTWADEILRKHAEDKLSAFKYLPINDVKHVLDAGEVPEDARNFRDLMRFYEESKVAVRYIKQSMSHCLENHKLTCDRMMFPISSAASQRYNAVNILSGRNGIVMAPTRLVYVGSHDVGDLSKLVDGQECLYKGGYLILSYRWGMTPKDAPWQLTTTTMPLFKTEIPLRILPQTLNDAIMLTRKLGEHYIWIDSMCILQDSTEDWQFEASNMTSIYGSAPMTLVAASSSVYGGMTDRRNPLRNSAASLDLQFTIWFLKINRLYIAKRTALKHTTTSTDRQSRLVLPGRFAFQQTSKLDAKIYNMVMSRRQRQPPQHPITGSRTTHPASPLQMTDSSHFTVSHAIKQAVHTLPDFSKMILGQGYFDVAIKTNSSDGQAVDTRNMLRLRGLEQKPQIGTTLRDPELIHAEAQPVSYFKTGAVKSGSVEISAYIVMARTAPVEPFLFNTWQDSHTYGRRNFIDPLTGDALGLIVFDVALEAKDGMLLRCALLQAGNMDLWEKNGTSGLGLALRVKAATAEHWKCTRVGYVQFTSAFGKYAQKCCVEIS